MTEKYTNSNLATYKNITSKSNPRKYGITKIVIHHMAGKMTGKQCADYFVNTTRQVSANYCIGYDGSIALNVEEKNRAWTTGDREIDHKAITIEVSDEQNKAPWSTSEKALKALIDLVTDICIRNNIKDCTYTGKKDGVLQMHKWYQNTECPGTYLSGKFPYIAGKVNEALKGRKEEPKPAPSEKLYRVQTGTFEVRENADNLEAKLKKAGFDTYMVKVGNIYKVQAGAYSAKANAEAMATKLKKAGFNTFITTESGSPVGNNTLQKKSNAQIAKEVIQGKWGNGAERKKRLKAAGYNYSAVQKEVNRLL